MALPTIEEIKGRPAFRFPHGNKVHYWMDFASWEGLPSNIVFYDCGEVVHGYRELRARGYGVKDDYGNGSVFIKPEYLAERELKE